MQPTNQPSGLNKPHQHLFAPGTRLLGVGPLAWQVFTKIVGDLMSRLKKDIKIKKKILLFFIQKNFKTPRLKDHSKPEPRDTPTLTFSVSSYLFAHVG